MIISLFSSLLEFCAAVYVSMAINNTVTKQFWTKDHENTIHTILRNYTNIETGQSVVNKLSQRIKQKKNRVFHIAQIRGGFMLSICVYFLCFIPFEPTSESIRFKFVYIASCLYTLLMCFVFQSLFTKWRRMVYSIILLLGLALCVLEYLDIDAIQPVDKYLSDTLIKMTIIGTVLLPIVYQLFVNWLNSSVYKGYLKERLDSEFAKYTSTMAGLQTKQKSMINSNYKCVTEDYYFKKDQDEDIPITRTNEIFFSRLEKSISPHMLELFFCYVKYYWKENVQNLRNLLSKLNKSGDKQKNKIQTINDYLKQSGSIGDSAAAKKNHKLAQSQQKFKNKRKK